MPPLSLCLNAGAMGRIDAESETLIPTGGVFDVAHTLRGEGFNASEDGSGRGVPLVADTAPTLGQRMRGPIDAMFDGALVAFSAQDHGNDCGDIAPTLRRGGDGGGVQPAVAFDARQSDVIQVRRLTPRECCRLQGFPDDYLDITYRGKPAADGPKYKALGNSMAVPCMRWIGRRIALVDALTKG